MKIIRYVVVAFLWGVANSYSQTSAIFGSFVASSPCGNVVRPLLKMPFEQECDFVKWKITLQQDPITKAPTTFSLTAVYGVSQPNTTGFINGGTQVEATGKMAHDERNTSQPPCRSLSAQSRPTCTFTFFCENGRQHYSSVVQR